MIGHDSPVGQSFLGGLFEVVRANGEKLNEMQVRFLLLGEERLKLQAGTIRSWVRGGYAPPHHDPSSDNLTIEEAYNVLGLPRDCTEAELKKTYRGKAADFHPDKLRSKNLPGEFVSFANDQLAKINQAHQVILNARGLK